LGEREEFLLKLRERDFLLGSCLVAAATMGGTHEGDVLELTWVLYNRLADPEVVLSATVTISDQHGNAVRTVKADPANGVIMADTMTDIQVVDIVLRETDGAGVELSDQLTWSFSDGGATLTWTISDDTKSAHGVVTQPVLLGDVTVTVTDPVGPSAAAFTDTITVTSSAPASISGTVTVSDAPPPGP